MKHLQFSVLAVFWLGTTALTHAATRYVDVNSATPTPPYTSWATAATNIQDAVDVADAGDKILVTNGVYRTGGQLGPFGIGVRVAGNRSVVIESVNGPQFTFIEGKKVTGTTNGVGAVRCVTLVNGATLTGFTLTNGATLESPWDYDGSGGGVYCVGSAAVVSNCVIVGNSAWRFGGGAFGGTLWNCTLEGNTAGDGGGAYSSTLNNCTLTGNVARSSGGGSHGSTLNNCRLTGNTALFNGGGGAYSGTLNNCAVIGNVATGPYAFGGGVAGATLTNCTIIGNIAKGPYAAGGGAYSATLNNCIAYYNTGRVLGDNYDLSTLNYCCTTPLPASGVGNISEDPQLASASHLSTSSPCIGCGSALYASGTDLDGEPWATPPSIGCDEYHGGSVTGAVSVAIQAAYTNVAVGFRASFQGLIEGRVNRSQWDFGDGTVISNQPYATHTWTQAGDYMVELRAYNESYPGSVVATVTVHVIAEPVYYVALNNLNPVPPYDSWATAANGIQEAIDVASVAGALVLVSNGVYQAGAHAVDGMSNRVAVTKPVRVQSINGPAVTHIVGHQEPGTVYGPTAVRCVYLTNDATLIGFTLTNGAVQGSGGGVMCESVSAVISNCVIVGNAASGNGGGAYGGTLYKCALQANSASSGGGAGESVLNNCVLTDNTASSGGGAMGGTLYNCTLADNMASDGGGAFLASLNNCFLTGNSAYFGGGDYSGKLNNCTVTGNIAKQSGGGIFASTLNNCIVYYNRAFISGDNYSGTDSYPPRFNYSCTTPLPVSGVGNISDAPQLASASHLSVDSPCRGAGTAAYATGLDLDSEPWATPPSMGCDEHWVGSVTGVLNVAILVTHTNVAVGFTVDFQALIEGRLSGSRWDFGGGTVVSNQPYISHTWTEAGDYVVELRAYNESHPAGMAASVTVHVEVQPVHYVALNNPSPTPPYNSWATAANRIQDAVEAATLPGALVLVSNGVYQTGAQAVYGMSNRLAVTKPVRVQSVNGPAATHIVGYQEPGTTNGPTAVRCVYLTNDASLTGFTLTNGAIPGFGGGVMCESVSAVVSNCAIVGNAASGNGGGAYGGTFWNCTLQGNSAWFGGGACNSSLRDCTFSNNSAARGGATYSSTLHKCILTDNSAYVGGGAYNGRLSDCTLTRNSTLLSQDAYGGGAFDAVLNGCVLTDNSALFGGGAAGGTLQNCILVGNSARSGGGTSGAHLKNCVLKRNTASDTGGGATGGTIENCFLAANSAGSGGGAYNSALKNCTVTGNHGYGVANVTLTNCIVYYNSPGNISGSFTLDHSCTTPLLISGMGNVSAVPQIAGNWHLTADSPCRGAGGATYASGSDLDGEPWANPPSIGCDEFWSGSVTGAMSVAFTASYTNAAVGTTLNFQEMIEGRVGASFWDFGDGTVISNLPYASHAWTMAGNYVVTLRAFNDSYPSGVATSITVRVVVNPVHYVALNNPNPLAPYTSWADAATNIQDAVNAAIPGGLVLVSNGVYQVGATAVDGVNNRVAVTKPLTIRSINGPTVTSIVGPGRCVYLTNGASISGFTLTNGTANSGGGIYCQSTSVVVSNCVLTGNSAGNQGGGAFQGTLWNCILSGNSAWYGGGAASAKLVNCLLVSNSAPGSSSFGGEGGGAYGARLTNCTIVGNSARYHGSGTYACQVANSILYYNAANLSSGDSHLSSLAFCWTKGNGGQPPLFVNTNGWADLHLRSNSPCINAGFNGYVAGGVDLDGNPRIAGGTVDIGAYEFQSPASVLSYAWAQRYGFLTDGTADYADSDGDGHNSWQEWRSDTNPTNSASVLRMLSPTNAVSGITVRWQSVGGRTYFLERANNLGTQPPFSLVTSNIIGQTGTTSFADTNAIGNDSFFYRVGVQQ